MREKIFAIIEPHFDSKASKTYDIILNSYNKQPLYHKERSN